MIIKDLFGKMPCGCDVYSYLLKNKSGASVKIITLGATIVSINVPDKNGILSDVVCGYDDVTSYLNNSGYQGAIIGRYGNRIENSAFLLDGHEYKLFNNEGNNHLHGGKSGFDKKIWDASAWEENETMFLKMSYLSKDMEEGYPGNLSVDILYSFDENNRFSINYRAKTDKKTVLNLTNHAYFNLSGYDSYKSIENHSLWIDSDKITAINKQLIPNGEVIDVTNTPFDFRALKLIGKEINADNEILRIGQGYDHNYILNNNSDYKHVLTLIDNESKRMLKLYTNQPCIQIYTANCINEEESPFKNGIPQKKRCAICLETQHAPNSPNIPQFKSTELDVGEEYNYTTTFEFQNI